MSLFSATNQERPYHQLLHNWFPDATYGFPYNDVRGRIPEIPYWWRLPTQIWLVLRIGWKLSSQARVKEEYRNLKNRFWGRRKLVTVMLLSRTLKKGRLTLAIGYFQDASSVCLKGYRNDFHFGMSFVPEWSWYCIHMVKSTSSA